MSKRRSKIIHLPFANQASYHAVEEREKNIIGSRIDEARKCAGLSLAEFSALLNRYGVTVSPSGINKWTMGTVVPNAYQLLAVCHALIWMRMSRTSAWIIPPALNEEGMEKVRAYRDDLIASGRYKPPVRAAAIRYIDKPVSNLAVSAGTGEFLGMGILRWSVSRKTPSQKRRSSASGFPATAWSQCITTGRSSGCSRVRLYPLERLEFSFTMDRAT